MNFDKLLSGGISPLNMPSREIIYSTIQFSSNRALPTFTISQLPGNCRSEKCIL